MDKRIESRGHLDGAEAGHAPGKYIDFVSEMPSFTNEDIEFVGEDRDEDDYEADEI